MEITITRALAELKLLNDRISGKILDGLFVVSAKRSSTKVNGTTTVTEFMDKAKMDYQSIMDLIARRKAIKTAIVQSNANTLVTVAGKTMTVADAIERKESINYQKLLLDSMQTQLANSKIIMERENIKVQQNLDNLLNTSFGRDSKNKISEEDYKAIATPYLEQNEFIIHNPIDIEKKITCIKEEIENFLMEVDFVLSESNTVTKITIPD